MCRVFSIIVLLMMVSLCSYGQQTHPSLLLTQEGVKEIRAAQAFPPLYEKSYSIAKQIVDSQIQQGIDVPIPKDMAGAYTHERHKLNYKTMQQAGFLYQITGDTSYAVYIRDMLFEYAAMYGGLPIHPTDRSYATGKIFWQCLNDANWLVYTSQAYDCIHDFLSEENRNYLEKDLFIPYANFLSEENPKFFNRIHNHSTWGNAAVGMIALVMEHEELLKKALYGLSNIQDESAKDNDGGFINEFEGDAGFLANLDHAFSPDGYYTEGPYYQRYAMTPFMLFAMALHNTKPEFKIFEYNNGVLLKAVEALVLQTSSSGEFFPINDAAKGMSIKAFSVVSALDICYFITGNRQLLDLALIQNEVRLDQTGFRVANDIHNGFLEQFNKRSVELRDGSAGDKGALGIVRSKGKSGDELTAVFKYTAQGMGHGHYDKLSYSFYENDLEVLQDYGAARWVNIDQKAGGRYLKENKTWAKQSIAHNTLVIDEKSHFSGKYEFANKNHSEPWYFNVSDADLQIVSAKEHNAYPEVDLQRTLLLWKDRDLEKPVLIDLFLTRGDDIHQYDLPFHYVEHFMKGSFEYDKDKVPSILGVNHGYQHLYKEASAGLDQDRTSFNWFNSGNFYTLNLMSSQGDSLIMARIGANDPDFNLRNDALVIHRKTGVKNPVFISVIEAHGSYSPVTEIPDHPYSQIEDIEILKNDWEYSIFMVKINGGNNYLFMLSHQNLNEEMQHKIMVEGIFYQWEGPFAKKVMLNK